MPHGSRNNLTRIDPRDPFVIDTRSLGRWPGARRKDSYTVPAPADLGVEMVGVPEGTDVELDLRLEAVMEGVLVSGTARSPLSGECARCLDPLTSSIEVEFQELYVYSDTRSGESAEDDERRLEGDLIVHKPKNQNTKKHTQPQTPQSQNNKPGLCT